MFKSSGIHHITAICGDPKVNLHFYQTVLGLRLVKKTVNFDDPATYHLYYGDESGAAGTIMTFFPWAGIAKAKAGAGEVVAITFEIPAGSAGYWTRHLAEQNVVYALDTNVKIPVIAFHDPDGLALELIEADSSDNKLGWGLNGVPAEHAIRGIHGATLLVSQIEKTAEVMVKGLGWTELSRASANGFTRLRFSAASGEPLGQYVDLLTHEDSEPARHGAGTVHHIAFRAATDADQAGMAAQIKALHIASTEQKDRNYFRSIYLREPSGVLFEIATDAPGFTVDEPLASLGQALKLPAQYEQHRASIEDNLPKLG